MCLLAVKTIEAVNTHVDLSPNWQVKFGAKRGMGPEKGMTLRKGAWCGTMLKGMGKTISR